MISTLTIVGHMGGDPVTRKAGEKEVVEFSVGCYAGKDKTNWIKCTVWHKAEGDRVLSMFRKGDKVTVTGTLGHIKGYQKKDGGAGIDIPLSVAGVEGPKRDAQPDRENTSGNEPLNDESVPF